MSAPREQFARNASRLGSAVDFARAAFDHGEPLIAVRKLLDAENALAGMLGACADLLAVERERMNGGTKMEQELRASVSAVAARKSGR